MRRPYIAGNWKMNLTPSEGASYAKELGEAVKKAGVDCRVMIAPSFVSIPAVLEAVKGTGITVAAQNMAITSPEHIPGRSHLRCLRILA